MQFVNVAPSSIHAGDTILALPGYKNNDFGFLAGTAEQVLIFKDAEVISSGQVHLVGNDYNAVLPLDHDLIKIVF